MHRTEEPQRANMCIVHLGIQVSCSIRQLALWWLICVPRTAKAQESTF